MTKLIFMGTPQFSVPILEGLHQAGYDIVAVVTQPDRLVGRKKVLTKTPVKQSAEALGLEVLQPEKLSGSEEMEHLLSLDADIIVTAAYGQFLPQTLLDAPKHGAINVHASLLPKYRGGAPIHYAVMNGDAQTGVTIMEMVKKMDAGAMIAQKAIDILPTDDTGLLFEKLSLVGRDLLLETLPHYLAGDITPVPQNEAEVTYAPNISREEERLSFETMTSQVMEQHVRGMRPFPIAHVMKDNKRMKLYETKPLEEHTTKEAGCVVAIHKDSFDVACQSGSVLRIFVLQPEGKAKMTATDYLNGVGRTLSVGDRFDG